MKEIPLKFNGNKNLILQFTLIEEIRSKVNDIKKSNSNNPLQFYIRYPFKNEHKKS